MKKIALLLVLSFFTFAACEKDEETLAPNGTNQDNPPAQNEELLRFVGSYNLSVDKLAVYVNGEQSEYSPESFTGSITIEPSETSEDSLIVKGSFVMSGTSLEVYNTRAALDDNGSLQLDANQLTVPSGMLVTMEHNPISYDPQQLVWNSSMSMDYGTTYHIVYELQNTATK